jgi:hypothetical protein
MTPTTATPARPRRRVRLAVLAGAVGLAAAAVAVGAAARRPAADRAAVVPAAYHVVGPFGPDLFQACGPEQAPDPGRGYRTAAGELRWKLVEAVPGAGCLDFARAFRRDNAAGYALTYAHSPTAADGELLVGSDDTVRVWVNGEAVHQATRFRVARPDEDRVPVRWRAGRNTVVAKVVNVTGDHLLYLKLVGPPGLRAGPSPD